GAQQTQVFKRKLWLGRQREPRYWYSRGVPSCLRFTTPQIRRGLPIPLPEIFVLPPLPHVTLPRSGYRSSDLVQWHKAGIFGTAAKLSLIGGLADPLGRAAPLPQLTPEQS